MPAMKADICEELEWRGLLSQMSDPDLPKLLANEQFILYAGFDPTGPSLHTGHLLQMLTLRRFQLAGHRPIAVAGGGTGMIGDPSGRETERMLLSPDEIGAHTEKIKKQLEPFIDFSPGEAQATLVNNADWLSDLNLIEFLRDIGKHFSLNMMIGKESVKARLEEREQGISYTEFSYMLLQSYDFLHLFDDYGCRLQTGGSDQWGNITAGIELIRRKRSETAYGLTTTLIVLPSGKKMSKSEGTAEWISAELTTPYRFFQYWINTEDREVGTFLRYYTFLSKDEIEDLEASAREHPERREAQRRLAREVTTLVHGAEEASRAEQAASALFGKEIRELDEKNLLEVFSEAPSFKVPRTNLGKASLIELVVELAPIFPSRGAARTDITAGGLYLNNERETDEQRRIDVGDLLHDRYLLIRRGKRSHYLISFD